MQTSSKTIYHGETHSRKPLKLSFLHSLHVNLFSLVNVCFSPSVCPACLRKINTKHKKEMRVCEWKVILPTSTWVFCRRSLSAGRRGYWLPGCAPVWTALTRRRLVPGKSDAGRRWGYLERKTEVALRLFQYVFHATTGHWLELNQLPRNLGGNLTSFRQKEPEPIWGPNYPAVWGV